MGSLGDARGMAADPRPRRSALYLPATNARALAKARTLPVDMVILDLEDAVAPARKEEARAAAVDAARSGDWGGRELLIRANALDTPWGAEDLAAAARSGAAGVVVPKIGGVGDIAAADATLAGAPAGFGLWAMIETCAAMLDLAAIARAARTTRLTGFVLGWNDLAKEMRAEPGTDRAVFQPFLAMAVAAARAEDIVVLDGVCNAIGDPDRFAAECRQGRAFGVDGKTLIHPSQVDPCNRIYSPDAAAIDRARRIVAAFDDGGDELGVVQVDGQMVERLHLAEARRTLTIAALLVP